MAVEISNDRHKVAQLHAKNYADLYSDLTAQPAFARVATSFAHHVSQAQQGEVIPAPLLDASFLRDLFDVKKLIQAAITRDALALRPLAEDAIRSLHAITFNIFDVEVETRSLQRYGMPIRASQSLCDNLQNLKSSSLFSGKPEIASPVEVELGSQYLSRSMKMAAGLASGVLLMLSLDTPKAAPKTQPLTPKDPPPIEATKYLPTPTMRQPSLDGKPGEFSKERVIGEVQRRSFFSPASRFWITGLYRINAEGGAERIAQESYSDTNTPAHVSVTFNVPTTRGSYPSLEGFFLHTPTAQTEHPFSISFSLYKQPEWKYLQDRSTDYPRDFRNLSAVQDDLKFFQDADKSKPAARVLSRALSDFTYIVSDEIAEKFDRLPGSWYAKVASIRIGDCDMLATYGAMLLHAQGSPAILEHGYIEKGGKIIGDSTHVRLRTPDGSWELTRAAKRAYVNVRLLPEDAELLEYFVKETLKSNPAQYEDGYALFRTALGMIFDKPYYKQFLAKNALDAGPTQDSKGLFAGLSWKEYVSIAADVGWKPLAVATLQGLVFGATAGFVGSVGFFIGYAFLARARNATIAKIQSKSFDRTLFDCVARENQQPSSVESTEYLHALQRWVVKAFEPDSVQGLKDGLGPSSCRDITGFIKAIILTRITCGDYFAQSVYQAFRQSRLLHKALSTTPSIDKAVEYVARKRQKVDVATEGSAEHAKSQVDAIIRKFTDFNRQATLITAQLPDGRGSRVKALSEYELRFQEVAEGESLDARSISHTHLARGLLMERRPDTTGVRAQRASHPVVVDLSTMADNDYVRLCDHLLEVGAHGCPAVYLYAAGGFQKVIVTNAQNDMVKSREGWARKVLSQVVEAAHHCPMSYGNYGASLNSGDLNMLTVLAILQQVTKTPALRRASYFGITAQLLHDFRLGNLAARPKARGGRRV
jgi:hypothetical protein